MKYFLFSVLSALSFASGAQDKTVVSFNLKNITKGRLHIHVKAPAIQTATVEFIIPQIIPGTYMKVNYRRFYSEIKAFTSGGRKLRTKQKDNRFIIYDATELDHLEYDVTQSFGDRFIWDNILGCAGTVFSPEEFLINYQLITGYFRDFENLPFEIRITHPENLYGATSAAPTSRTREDDIFTAANYSALIAAPSFL